MRYLDTSILVTAITPDEHTPEIRAWLATCEPGGLMISDWTATEFSSALSMKVWTGTLSVRSRSLAQVAFDHLAEESLVVVPVTRANFRTAGVLSQQYETGIRAADALHLAVAASHEATVHTLDAGQARQGANLVGIDGLTVVPVPLQDSDGA